VAGGRKRAPPLLHGVLHPKKSFRVFQKKPLGAPPKLCSSMDSNEPLRAKGWAVLTHNVSATSPIHDAKLINAVIFVKLGDSNSGESVGKSALISERAMEPGRPCMMLVRLLKVSMISRKTHGRMLTFQACTLSRTDDFEVQSSCYRNSRRHICDAYRSE
jgi:hypothetical protein